MTTQHPDLTQSLISQDLGYLRIVAELWGIDIQVSDQHTTIEKLTPELLKPARVEVMLENLPAEARAALDELVQHKGSIPWSRFTRRFGEVREMGPGRRDREKPYQDTISPGEDLWYRGLVGRAFFDSATGPREYAYIPSDLLALLPRPQENSAPTLGRKASRKDRQHPYLATDRILDHACTLLAALRMDFPTETIAKHAEQWKSPSGRHVTYASNLNALLELLAAAGLLGKESNPQPEATRAFLEANRGAALAQLAGAWLNSPDFNELHLIQEFQIEGSWENDPLRTRQEIIRFLFCVPAGTWWNLNSMITGIQEYFPDFQRPTGDYDSWFIRDVRTGEYLHGFDHWEQVDGALIRFTVTGPLHWLGILDLAAPSENAPIEAFRLSKWAHELLAGSAPEGLPVEQDHILALSDGRLRVPRLTARAARYQVARFCTWDSQDDDIYKYRLSPSSLQHAKNQGLQINHLLRILDRYTTSSPPTLIKALERWEERGIEARIEHLYVLRLSSPVILKQLRASRAARFLGEPLGSTSIIVKTGAREKVMAALAEMGYLGEIILIE